MAITNNVNYGFNAVSGTNVFSGFLLVGNNTSGNCNVTAGTGLTTVTCSSTGTDGSTIASPSNATLWNGAARTVTNQFTISGGAKVTTTDASNANNISGTNLYDVTMDWFNFANPFRTWGLSGAWPGTASGGACTSTFTCQIYDWTLSNAGTVFYNRSGNGNTANNTFTNGAACPAEVDGTTGAFTDLNSRVFLANAVEIMDDGVGNDNGLCETNEDCIFTPNIGVYQGSGTYTGQSCTFTDGTISGVKMYKYTTN